ncbi:MAG: glycogen synthase [Clostridiales Family XIII bacterium]|nr:glycogen synthase [Clostridiales Family XIII bacterium]
MKILFAASEARPFFVSDGPGDMAGSLPPALRRRNADIRVVLPLYGDLGDEWRGKLKHVASFVVPVGWRSQYCGLFELSWQDVTWYFLDNEYYFRRGGLYGFYDDGERFAFFSRAVLETVSNIGFEPGILHCVDWQTALVPVYLNLYYRHIEKFARLKTVFTIRDIRRQCIYDPEILVGTLGIEREDGHMLEYGGAVNLTKGAIEAGDVVNTVSPSYAREILEPGRGFGLSDFLKSRRHKISGILNGIDIGMYNPLSDPHIAANYGLDDFREGKPACAKALREGFGLDDDGSPIMGMLTPLTDDRGLDMFRSLADRLLDEGLQIVLAGSGEAAHEAFLRELAERRPGRFALRLAPSAKDERAIYAGSDMLLLLSRSEPCVFEQMAALRYGTAPVAYASGGLRDTVHESVGGGNGFVFAAYEAPDIIEACLRAKKAMGDREKRDGIIRNAMLCDNSWASAAERYVGLYRQAEGLW